MATTLPLVEIYTSNSRKSGDISFIRCRVILDGAEQNAEFRSKVGEEPIIVGDDSITVSDESVAAMRKAAAFNAQDQARRAEQLEREVVAALADLDARLDTLGTSDVARAELHQLYRAEPLMATAQPYHTGYDRFQQKVKAIIDRDAAEMAAANNPVLDTLIGEIADLEAAQASIPVNPRTPAEMIRGHVDRTVITGKLAGLYPMLSNQLVNHIMNRCDSVADARGFSDFDLRVYEAGARVRRSGYLTGDFTSRSAKDAAHSLAFVACRIDGHPLDTRRAVALGRELGSWDVGWGREDKWDPREWIARALDDLLDQTKRFYGQDDDVPDIEFVPHVMSGDMLKSRRLSLGLSARAFAEMVGVESDRTVRRWESGEREVPGPVAVIVHAIVKHRGVRGYFQIPDAGEADFARDEDAE